MNYIESMIYQYVVTKNEMIKLANNDPYKQIGEDVVGALGTMTPLYSTVFNMIPKVAPVLFSVGAVPGGLWWLLNKEIEADKLKSKRKLYKLEQMLNEAEGK